jgi:CP family cyanate transporter-like MFS transporter
MGLGAISGVFLISRLGARHAVTIGLGLVTMGTALRGVLPSVSTLFTFTILLAVGIALVQPAIPSLVKSWFPGHIGRATAVYSNGIFAGEVIAAIATIPVLMGAFGLGWQGALSAWAAPVALLLFLWSAFAPRTEETSTPSRAPWLPDWRHAPTLGSGFLMGGASVVYFGTNTWIPDTLTARGSAQLIPLSLGVLNAMQLPVSAALALVGDRLLGRSWPYVFAGFLCLGGVIGYVVAPAGAAPVFAGMLGAGASLVFTLNLGLPALLAPDQVGRVSGFMFAIGYGCAFLAPSAGGVAWDLTRNYLFALLPIAIAAVVILVLGATLPRWLPAGAAPPAAFPPAA